MTVQTPALDLVDNALVEVDKAVGVMMRRRETIAHLRRDGLDEIAARDQASIEIPDAGINRLIVSLSPQEGKSERVTRYGALWMLRRWSDLRCAIVSYGEHIAQEMGWKIRSDIETYNGEEGNVDLGLRLMKDSKAKGDWKLAGHKGSVYATGVGGPLTGRPVDLLLIDDPVKDALAADSEISSSNAWLWWHAVATTRLAPGAPVIVILTRWHEADLAGRLLTKQAEDEKSELAHFDRWHVINIAAQADYAPPTDREWDPYEFDPLGRQPGEFMASARGRTQEQWESIKASKPPRVWSALYQGKPTPDSGDVFNRNWWRRFDSPTWTGQADGSYQVHEANEVLQAWVMTVKDKNSSDFVVGQVWARKGAYVYLLDQVRARMSFTTTVDAFRRMCRKWPQSTLKLVEDKANGAAVMDTLRREIGGIVGVQVGANEGSKIARAAAVSHVVESGNVFVPNMGIAVEGFDPEGFVVECTQFPNGAHDDQVDAMTQALRRFFITGSSAGAWLEAQAPPCEECGQPNPKGSTKCSKCGADIKPDETVEAAEPAHEEPWSLTSGMGTIPAPNPQVAEVQRVIRELTPQKPWYY